MTEKHTLWEFWVLDHARFVCPYFEDGCEFEASIDKHTLTELHEIARNHWAEDHND